jgi:hypothetical protein
LTLPLPHLFALLISKGKCEPKEAWSLYCLSEKLCGNIDIAGEGTARQRKVLLCQVLQICREANALHLSQLAIDEMLGDLDQIMNEETAVVATLDAKVLPEVLLTLATLGDVDRCAEVFESFLDSDINSMADPNSVHVWSALFQAYFQNKMWVEIIELYELYEQVAAPTTDMLEAVIVAKCEVGLGKDIPVVFESTLDNGGVICALELFNSTTKMLASRQELGSIYKLYQLFNKKEVRLPDDSYYELICGMRECNVSSKQYFHMLGDMIHLGVAPNASSWDVLFVAIAQEGDSAALDEFLLVWNKHTAGKPDSERWMFTDTLRRFLELCIIHPGINEGQNEGYINSDARLRVFSELIRHSDTHLVPVPIMQGVLASCHVDHGWAQADDIFHWHEQICNSKAFNTVRVCCCYCSAALTHNCGLPFPFLLVRNMGIVIFRLHLCASDR